MATESVAVAAAVRSSLEAERKRNVARAQSILRGAEPPAAEIYDLAERLKGQNAFGYARRLFGRLRSRKDYAGLKKTPAKVGQRQALCTYKDPDLPAADRFRRALEILDEVDGLKLETGEIQESLGLRGAVYKRMWQVEGQPADLERSLAFYLKGYEMGPEADQGYTGINAAFVLDLLAREEAVQVAKAGTSFSLVDERWRHARDIRRKLAALLPDLAKDPKRAWLNQEWWFFATRAEAHLGLGEFERALATLREYNESLGLGHDGPPLEKLNPWEFESTLTQLASLASLQADLAALMKGRPEEKEWPCTAEEFRGRASRMLRDYLGELAPGVDRALVGKVGLALSGGGFRASLFHIGVLAHLAERDLLRRVEALSCVSGGSIVGAHYYLEVQRLLESKEDQEITRADYVDIVRRLEERFLAGVQTNIRSRVFGSIWANLRTFFEPAYTTTRRLGELYEAELYARVDDGRGGKARHLDDLFVTPLGDPGFKPKYDNWRRAAKVPILVLNATTLNTGHNWQFTASWMGEPPTSVDAEIDGNYRLRRMYYWEAPRLEDKWQRRYRRVFSPPDYRRFRLGAAVAASSCVPGLFEPLVLPDLYPVKTVRLVDGGVYDNQGVASLLEQDCNVMIVSDGSGQMDTLDHPGGSRLGVSLRSYSVSMARVRQAEYRELAARRRSGLLKSLVFLHLKKDLDADPVDWRECQDPHDASDEARPAARRGVRTSYGIQKSVQRLLSAIRTDLDSFTEVEAFSLMTSGYRQAEVGCGQLRELPEAPPPKEEWRFLQVEPILTPGTGFDDLTRQLKTAAMTAGKVWRLWPPLTITAGVLLLAALFGAYLLWDANQERVLVTVRGLGITLAVFAATLVAPHVVRFIRFHQTFRDVGLRSAFAAALAIGFKIHLLWFDPLFLRLGRVSRLLKLRQPAG